MTTDIQQVAGADLLRFADLIEARLGLEFSPAEHHRLAALMRERMHETGSFDFGCYECLCHGSREELRILASKLTVPETYFFREPEQIAALHQAVIPWLQRDTPHRHIRIISVGCSTGEEPFSLAIALKETPALDLSSISIIGIDVNLQSIEKGGRGRFPKWSMRAMPAEYLKKYFHPDGDGFVLDDRIRAMVHLEERNLAEDDPDLWRPNSYDVIFCRNVLMYFSAAKMMESVARFARTIAADGFLFLGAAETLRGISHDFHLQHGPGCFYYSRQAPTAGNGEILRAKASPPPSPVPAVVMPAVESAGVATADGAGAPPQSVANGGAAAPATASLPRLARFAEATDRFRTGRAREALQILQDLPAEERGDPDAIVLTAAILAERGSTQEAARLCSSLLANDDLNLSAHYLMGYCNEQRGRSAEAIESYQTAVYLDPAFAMPHLRLGQLFKRQGDLRQARHELAQASILLSRENAARIVLFGNGFSRGALAELCRSELRACDGQQ